jgi:hypothetical protein
MSETLPAPGGQAPSVDLDPVRSKLRTEVIEILRREISILTPLTRETAYDTVLDQPTILAECFALFRAKTDLFADLLVDAKGQASTSDDAPLSCGRSVADIIALLVRASARRHFRTNLAPARPAAPRRPPAKSTMRRLAEWLGLIRPPPRPPARKRQPSRADLLYDAIKTYLRFDWQAALIPHYAQLRPQTVAALGPRLMDIREATELKVLAESPDKNGQVDLLPLLFDEATRLLVPGGRAIDPKILEKVIAQMDLGRLFPGRNPTQMRHAFAQVAATDPDVLAALMPILGSDIRRFTTFLVVAHNSLGGPRFRQFFVNKNNPDKLKGWLARLAKTDLPPPRLDDMRATYEALFTTCG